MNGKIFTGVPFQINLHGLIIKRMREWVCEGVWQEGREGKKEQSLAQT